MDLVALFLCVIIQCFCPPFLVSHSGSILLLVMKHETSLPKLYNIFAQLIPYSLLLANKNHSWLNKYLIHTQSKQKSLVTVQDLCIENIWSHFLNLNRIMTNPPPGGILLGHTSMNLKGSVLTKNPSDWGATSFYCTTMAKTDNNNIRKVWEKK